MLETAEDIKVISLRIERIGVSSFSVQDQTVTFNIKFTDGITKEVYKTTKVEEPRELAETIIAELIRMEENTHMEFDGEQMIATTHVIPENYDMAVRHLTEFMRTIETKLKIILHSDVADGYMRLVNNLTSSELVLIGR